MSNVLVAVRVRPMNLREEEQGSKFAVKIESNVIQLTNFKMHGHQDYDSRARTRHFSFDFCYWTAEKNASNYASQETIYRDLGNKVLEAIFSGFNACVLAYGQSGSGKTYTMMGNNDDLGLVPRICQGLFERINQQKKNNVKFRTEISFLEIYNERVSDLLKPRCHFKRPIKQTLRVREHPKTGPCVQDLSKHLVNGYDQVIALLEKGIQNRNIAATKMHDHSSRSHAIFTIVFTQARLDTDMPSEMVSKIQLVDLAGSEKAGVHTNKIRLKEGANINKSLVALGSVICTLADKSMSHSNAGSPTLRGSQRRSSGVGNVGGQTPFVPYRDSVLTWLLKDSLGGNSKTILVATISPASSAFSETINTLRYAQRAKCIVNKPIINEDPKVKLIRELKLEVEKLRELLANAQKAIGNMLVADMINRNQDKADELTKIWIEKWNEVRDQKATCNNCFHKFPSTQISNCDKDANTCLDLLSTFNQKVNEDHVQSIYNMASSQMFNTEDSNPTIKDSTTDNNSIMDSSDSSCLSKEKINNEEDEWLNMEEQNYLPLNPLKPDFLQIKESTFCSISESNQSISADELFTECFDNVAFPPANTLIDNNLPQQQFDPHFKIPAKIFDCSASDSEFENDSLENYPSDENARLEKNQQLNKPIEMWTSESCQQQNMEFGFIQPQTATAQIQQWTSALALNTLTSTASATIMNFDQELHHRSEYESNNDTEESLEVHYCRLINMSSSSENENQRNKSLSKYKSSNPKRYSLFEQRLNAIRRRKRKKFPSKIKKQLIASDDSIKDSDLKLNKNLSSPPPLPNPLFINESKTNVLLLNRNDELKSDNQINLTNNVNANFTDPPKTSWREVTNNNPINTKEQPIAFDCTSWINSQSWPSCDSLTMVYVGPKWTSEKENGINNIESFEQSVDINEEINNSILELTAKDCRHPNVDPPNNYCTCNWSQLQISNGWSEFQNHSDSTMNCAEVSTQTDSGIQMDQSFPNQNRHSRDWSYSTINVQQSKTTNNGVQTEVIRCHNTSQTEPLTTSVSQQTEQLENLKLFNTDACDSCTKKCANDILPMPKNEQFEINYEKPVRMSEYQEPNKSKTCNSEIKNEKNISTKTTSTLPIVSNYDSGIYIGFHGIGKTFPDVQVNIKMKGDGENKQINVDDDLITVGATIINKLLNDKNCDQNYAENDIFKIITPPEEFQGKMQNQDILVCLNDISPKIDPSLVDTYQSPTKQNNAKSKVDNISKLDGNCAITTHQNSKIIPVFKDINITENVELSDDEYYQLPQMCKSQLSSTLINPINSDKCTCKFWNCLPNDHVHNRMEEEDINSNLPEDICQLLKECREVRKKAWSEIALAQQQLRYTASMLSNECSACAVHGKFNFDWPI